MSSHDVNEDRDLQGKIVEKGWGCEQWVHNSELYCGKLLRFEAGKRCSLHYHRGKHETFYLQSGRLACLFYEYPVPGEDPMPELIVMNPGDIREIPPYTVHQMHAIEDSVLIEFSTQHHDEDSYRIRKGD